MKGTLFRLVGQTIKSVIPICAYIHEEFTLMNIETSAKKGIYKSFGNYLGFLPSEKALKAT